MGRQNGMLPDSRARRGGHPEFLGASAVSLARSTTPAGVAARRGSRKFPKHRRPAATSQARGKHARIRIESAALLRDGVWTVTTKWKTEAIRRQPEGDFRTSGLQRSVWHIALWRCATGSPFARDAALSHRSSRRVSLTDYHGFVPPKVRIAAPCERRCDGVDAWITAPDRAWR